MREIRIALLEADVNFKVVKDFIERVRARAIGQEVVSTLSPGQQVVKIVHDEMVSMLGGTSSRLLFTSRRPNSVMIVGLQGSGKTTSTGKIARWLQNQHRKPLLLSVDVYRPAARDQLAVIGGAINLPVFDGVGNQRSSRTLPGGATPLRAGRLRHADDRHGGSPAHRR